MTEIPEDIMKAATETAASWYHEEWEPEEYICKLLVEYIATALLAERKRCEAEFDRKMKDMANEINEVSA